MRTRRIYPSRCSAAFLLAALMLAHPMAARPAGPLSPADALKSFEIEPGFKIELFAAEPHVVDPVVIAFDEYGRVFAAEMRELEVIPADKPGTLGTIKLLEDRDGDGAIDHSTIFADGLSFPGGLAPSAGGLYALCTPDILYLKDNDGDGDADEKRVVLTGFAQGNAEHRFNNLTWSMDNWIYAANGHGGGTIFEPKSPDAKLDLAGRDFRMRPGPFAFEPVARQVPGGFGLSFDDWGRRYVCQNELHAMHVVLAEADLGRNKHLDVRELGEDITGDGKVDDEVYPLSQPQGWRIERTSRRAREMADKFRPTQLKANGYFTAAAGVTIYRGDLFPQSHRGNLFVCDAAQNLVHRATVEEAGLSMRARRAAPGAEFLRTADQYFRPVNLCSGPDGALYVVSVCREIIETAASIPPDILAKLDLRAGSDRGRIYRIVPEDCSEPWRPQRPAEMNSAELAAMLAHADAWHRLAAQRLLIERGAKDQAPRLRAMAADCPEPLGRVHALWTLSGLGALDEATTMKALDDPHPRVREHAAELAKQLLRNR